MKYISKSLILIYIGLIAGCAHVYDVNYDYDENTDFTNFKSYDWMPISQESRESRRNSELVEEAVDAELQARGLKLNTDNPDVLVTGRLGTKETVSKGIKAPEFSSFRRRSTGNRGAATTEIEVGSLVLDMVDAKSKKIIWRGNAKAVVDETDSPERSEKLIRKAVQKILKNFPPTQ